MRLVRIKIAYLGENTVIKVDSSDSVSQIIQKINANVLNGGDEQYGMSDFEILNNYSFNLSNQPLVTNFNVLNHKLCDVVNSKRFELRVVKNVCGGTSNTFPSWVKTEDKECVVFGDTHKCAKLECNCYISFEGARKFVEKKMSTNDVLICEGCDKLLNNVDDILQLCSFDETKEDNYYNTLTKKHRIYVKYNGQQGDLGDAQCPHCETINRRTSLLAYKMQCAKCSKHFCYECEENWKKSGKVLCGNTKCATWELQQDLLECDPLSSDPQRGLSWVDMINKKHNLTTKKDKLPAYRACIGCWNISTVVQNCRHITCNECKMYYCFVCLKPMAGHNDTTCTNTKPAPRQILN